MPTKVKRRISGFLCLFCIVAHSLSVSLPIGTPMLGDNDGWNNTSTNDLRINDPNLLLEIPEEWVGVGIGQTRLLFHDYAAVHGHTYIPRDQGNSPSCVGQATAAAVDFLAAVEIHSFGEAERAPPGAAAACAIYGLSRQEIGELGPDVGGGSMNIWACQAIQQYGVIARLQYPMLGYDLREPSAARAIKFGSKGLSRGLEMVAKIHPVKDYIAINSYEDLRDAVAMGYPVTIGSSQGFGNGKLTRDSEGFLSPPFRIFRPSVWNHSLCCIGVCDEGRRGALILNSWGGEPEDGSGWISGPDRFPGTPEGCFFVDASIIDYMVKHGDSFAIRGYKGYKSYQIFQR